jgi:hypothetical protein
MPAMDEQQRLALTKLTPHHMLPVNINQMTLALFFVFSHPIKGELIDRSCHRRKSSIIAMLFKVCK